MLTMAAKTTPGGGGASQVSSPAVSIDYERKMLNCLLRLGKPDSAENKAQGKTWLSNHIVAVKVAELCDNDQKLTKYIRELSQQDDDSWNTWKTIPKRSTGKSGRNRGSGKGKERDKEKKCLWTDLKLRPADWALPDGNPPTLLRKDALATGASGLAMCDQTTYQDLADLTTRHPLAVLLPPNAAHQLKKSEQSKGSKREILEVFFHAKVQILMNHG